MQPTGNIGRFLLLDEVLQLIGIGRNTVYRRIREGTFLKQVNIGPNSVAWRQSDITQWMPLSPPATTNPYIEQYTETTDSAQAHIPPAIQVH